MSVVHVINNAMPLAPGHRYEILFNEGFHIVLISKTEVEPESPDVLRTKKFFQLVGNIRQLADHMDSLTESQCEQFLKPERQSKEKKAEAKAKKNV